MRKPQRTPDPAAVARSMRELKALFAENRPPEKQSAAGKSGAKPESDANQKPACGDCNVPAKNFNADEFMRACAGDVALLHLALVNLANNRTLNNPAEVQMAGRNIALSWRAAGGESC